VIHQLFDRHHVINVLGAFAARTERPGVIALPDRVSFKSIRSLAPLAQAVIGSPPPSSKQHHHTALDNMEQLMRIACSWKSG
jgi:hypothetical protein